MNIYGLKASLLSLIAVSLVACGGGSSDPAPSPSDTPTSGLTSSPAPTPTPPVPSPDPEQEVDINIVQPISPLTVSDDLVKVDNVDFDALDKTGSWRISTRSANAIMVEDIGIVDFVGGSVEHIQQASLLQDAVFEDGFLFCGEFDSPFATSFTRLNDFYRFEADFVKENVCPPSTLEASRSDYQSGNTFEYRYACDSKVYRITTFERVSDIANVGVGTAELSVDDSPVESSQKACASTIIADTSLREDPDLSFETVELTVVIPQGDDQIELEFSYIAFFDRLGTFIIEEDTEVLANGGEFSFDQGATSGSFTVTALDASLLEISFDLTFVELGSDPINLTGSAQINL